MALPIPVPDTTPRYLRSDYAGAAHALMPRGRAWSDDPSSIQQRLLAALAIAFERSDSAASGILSGSVPGATSASLPDWEAGLGIAYTGSPPSIATRTEQVRVRFARDGGSSRQHFIDFASALGFAIEIENYRAGMPGPAALGLANDNPAWIFVWGVRVIANAGPLTRAALLAELDDAKPAETIVVLLN